MPTVNNDSGILFLVNTWYEGVAGLCRHILHAVPFVTMMLIVVSHLYSSSFFSPNSLKHLKLFDSVL
jgi:hypothetical protein